MIDWLDEVNIDINLILNNYFESKNNEYLNEFINEVKSNNYFNIDKKFLPQKIGDKSILEILLDNTGYLNMNDDAINYIKNNSNLLKILLNSSNNIVFTLDELLNIKIDNYTLLEYLFIIDKISYNEIFVFTDNRIIIDLCVKYRRLDLLQFLSTEELLLSKLYKNKLVIEYLFEKKLISTRIIQSINNPIIYDYIIKFHQDDLLSFLNENVLLTKKFGKTLLETFIENNIEIGAVFTKKESIDIILANKRYDLFENNSVKLLLDTNNDYNKSIFEILLEHHYTCDKIKNAIIYNSVFHDIETIINIIYKHKRFDLLLNADENILLSKSPNGKTVYEDLILNGLTPIPKDIIRNPNLINLAVKYNKYESLSNSSKYILYTRLDNGLRIIDILIDKNIPVTSEKIDSYELVDKIIEGRKYNLYKCISDDILYSHGSYINKILMSIDRNDISSILDINSSSINIYDPNTVKKYIIFAKHNLHKYLPKLEVFQLTSDVNGKKFIEYLLDEDEKTTVNKLLDNDTKSNPSIAIILKSRGINQTEKNFDSIRDNLSKKYIEIISNKNGQIKLSKDDEELLSYFKKVFNDMKSNKELLNILINNYRYLLNIDDKYRTEINQLIKIKINNPEFSFKKCDESYYDSDNNLIAAMPYLTHLDHEIGHALLHNLADNLNFLPSNLENIILNLRKDPEFLIRVKMFSDMQTKTIKQIKDRVDRTYINEYNKSFNAFKMARLKFLLQKDKFAIKRECIKEGYSKELTDRLLSEDYTIQEYVNKDKQIQKENITSLIYTTEYDYLPCISDIIDGIMNGIFYDQVLYDKYGSRIKGEYGHGMNYYNNGGLELIFDEFIANYSCIDKSQMREEGLEALRYFIGDELFDLISNYYNNELLNSSKYSVIL